MRTKNVVAVLFGMFLLPAAVAHAEGPQPGEAGYVDPQYQQQQQQQVIADPNAQQQQGPVVEEQSSNQQAQEGRGIEYGLYLTVPIFATAPFGSDPATGTDTVSVGPGIGIIGRVGWEFGSGFAAELNIGFQYNGVTYDGLSSSTTLGLTNVFGGAGLRYSFLNPSALVPFIGAGLQLNFWGMEASSGGATVSTSNDKMSVGINALVGIAYEVSADLALEAGLRMDYTTPPKNDAGDNIFDGGQVYLSPFIGGTLYY